MDQITTNTKGPTVFILAIYRFGYFYSFVVEVAREITLNCKMFLQGKQK